MSYQKILVGEISSEIDKLIEIKKVIDLDGVTATVCNNHSHELIEDAPFSTYNNYTNVRSEVRKIMGKKIDVDESTGTGQLTIQGFEFVQRYYSIKRNGEQVGVPVEQLTQEEIQQKADDLIKAGKTQIKHGQELLKFGQMVLNYA